jgi:hypothetical protein
MSASSLKADIATAMVEVRFGPEADIDPASGGVLDNRSKPAFLKPDYGPLRP